MSYRWHCERTSPFWCTLRHRNTNWRLSLRHWQWGRTSAGELRHRLNIIGLYHEDAIAIESEAKDPFGGNVFSPSHLSASTLRSVPARIMTCQCPRSSAISVVIWFLAISSLTRSRHLSFGRPRFRFPSTVICKIFLVASSLSLLWTCPNHLSLFSLRNSTIGYMHASFQMSTFLTWSSLVFPLAQFYLVVMCTTSQCKLRYTFRNLRVKNVICIVT